VVAASTPDEIQRAVEDLKQRGATAFVLDLRDNPGGLLDAGVNIARLFLKEGVVMQQQYRGQEVKTFEVEKPGPLADLPLAVLINKGSASAAEIAAGALQAHKRADLIGEPSYGKDSIQLVFTLQDGSSLHVTSAHWWVPGLQTPVGQNGLQPDILVDPAGSVAGSDPYLQAAIRRLLGAS
jgi:carboxyl-terminal processing protease